MNVIETSLPGDLIEEDPPQVGVDWPLDGIEPVLSAKDAAGLPLTQCEVYP